MNVIRTLSLTAALVATVSSMAVAADDQTTTVTMKALSGSGEDGKAVLTQTPEGVKVVVTIKNAPKDVDQPTHIHIGTCGAIKKAPEYGLTNTTNGTGTSLVKGIKLADLMKQKYAINVHKSADDLGTYVSCGDIK